MIYLAIPYTFNSELSFKIANEVAGELMSDGTGKIVFSPISHSHPIAGHLDESLRYSQQFWLRQDLAFLSNCDRAIFILIGGFTEGMKLLSESKGCMTELQYCNDHKIPVFYHVYGAPSRLEVYSLDTPSV